LCDKVVDGPILINYMFMRGIYVDEASEYKP